MDIYNIGAGLMIIGGIGVAANELMSTGEQPDPEPIVVVAAAPTLAAPQPAIVAVEPAAKKPRHLACRNCTGFYKEAE